MPGQRRAVCAAGEPGRGAPPRDTTTLKVARPRRKSTVGPSRLLWAARGPSPLPPEARAPDRPRWRSSRLPVPERRAPTPGQPEARPHEQAAAPTPRPGAADRLPAGPRPSPGPSNETPGAARPRGIRARSRPCRPRPRSPALRIAPPAPHRTTQECRSKDLSQRPRRSGRKTRSGDRRGSDSTDRPWSGRSRPCSSPRSATTRSRARRSTAATPTHACMPRTDAVGPCAFTKCPRGPACGTRAPCVAGPVCSLDVSIRSGRVDLMGPCAASSFSPARRSGPTAPPPPARAPTSRSCTMVGSWVLSARRTWREASTSL